MDSHDSAVFVCSVHSSLPDFCNRDGDHEDVERVAGGDDGGRGHGGGRAARRAEAVADVGCLPGVEYP